MTDEQPTPEAQTEVLSTAVGDSPKVFQLSRRLVLLLGGVAALLTVIVILLIVLLQQRGPSPEPEEIPIVAVSEDDAEEPDTTESEAPVEPSPSATQQPPAPPAPAPPAPVIRAFSVVSSDPRSHCSTPGTMMAAVVFEWESNVLNNRAELRRDSANGGLIQGNLPSNGSWQLDINCDIRSDLTVVLVMKGDGGTQSTAVIEMAAPAAPRVDALSYSIQNVLAPVSVLHDECVEATKPGGSQQALVRLSWTSANAASLAFTRTVQPGGVSGNVTSTTLPTSGTHLTTYQCAWTAATYTLTVTGHDGSTVFRSVTVTR